MALFVIGSGGLLLLQADKLSRMVRDNIEIHVYLDKYITPEETATLERKLALRPYLEPGENEANLRFISKDEAAKKFIQASGEDFVSFLGENPLRDAYVVKVRPEFYDSRKMKIIGEDLQKIPGVFEATYVENLVDDINRNLLKITFVLLVFAGILVITIAVLINNTIKLALFSQRFLIRSMQLVGATSAFIQRPFLVRALVQGFCSGILASGLLLVALYYANTELNELVMLQNDDSLLALCVGLCLMGTIISLISSYRSVNKYLRMSLDELY